LRTSEPAAYANPSESLCWGIWRKQAGGITESEERSLLREAARRPRDARKTLRKAKSLRDAVFEIFSAAAGGRRPPRGALTALNITLPSALAQRSLRETARARFAWFWRSEDSERALERVLWPVIWEAASLLTSRELDRVRECAADSCAWLFLDRSKNQTRRWCDMTVCGNRTKARRHYARIKKGRKG